MQFYWCWFCSTADAKPSGSRHMLSLWWDDATTDAVRAGRDSSPMMRRASLYPLDPSDVQALGQQGVMLAWEVSRRRYEYFARGWDGVWSMFMTRQDALAAAKRNVSPAMLAGVPLSFEEQSLRGNGSPLAGRQAVKKSPDFLLARDAWSSHDEPASAATFRCAGNANATMAAAWDGDAPRGTEATRVGTSSPASQMSTASETESAPSSPEEVSAPSGSSAAKPHGGRSQRRHSHPKSSRAANPSKGSRPPSLPGSSRKQSPPRTPLKNSPFSNSRALVRGPSRV